MLSLVVLPRDPTRIECFTFIKTSSKLTCLSNEQAFLHLDGLVSIVPRQLLRNITNQFWTLFIFVHADLVEIIRHQTLTIQSG